MKKLFVFVSVVAVTIITTTGSYSAQYWAKTFKENVRSGAKVIQQTSDGGYVMAGGTSFDTGNSDFWLVKLDDSGNIIWEKTYGGIARDTLYSMQQTTDGGYILTGWSESLCNCFWVLKVDSTGIVEWQKTYEGNAAPYSIQQTSDGGYVVAGYVVAWYGRVIKLDSDGEVMWITQLVGAKLWSIQQTSDTGYIVTGWTATYGAGSYDILVVKLDTNGTVLWQKTYGGTESDTPKSIQQTSDAVYVLAGITESFSTVEQAWILKLYSDGDIAWQKTYGGNYGEQANSIQQTSDGGYVVGGRTKPFGSGDASMDLWVLKLNSSGDVSWEKRYEGNRADIASSIQQTTDGGYIVAGDTSSFGAGDFSAFVLKLDTNGEIPACSLVGAINNTVTDTSITGLDISATIQSPSITSTNTSITSQDSSTEITTFCSDLVGYWKFDEEEGDAVEDWSGMENHGTINGSAEWIANGSCGHALSFDGVDDWINAGEDNSLDMGTTDYTTEAWVKWYPSLEQDGYGDWILFQSQGYGIAVTDAGIVRIVSWGDPPIEDIDTGYMLTEGQWYHLTVVQEELVPRRRLYVNGIHEFTDTQSFSVADGTTFFIGGGQSCCTDRDFNGLIDGVRVYNRVLSEDEIREDMCTCAPVGMDADADALSDICDNCPNHHNPNQLDTHPPQGNGIGDVCDCECDFDCSGGVDAIDVTSFLVDFGRSTFNNPCSDADPCNGDVDCNVNVDALDLNKFLEDFGRSHFNNPCPPCQVEPWCVYDMCPYCDKVNVTIRVPEELGQQPGFLIAYLWSVDNWEFPPLVPPDAGTDYNQVRNPDIDIDNSYVMTVPGCTFYRERCVSGDYYLYVLLQMEGPSMPLVPQLGDYCWGMDQDPITLGSGQMLEIDKDITLVPFVAP